MASVGLLAFLIFYLSIVSAKTWSLAKADECVAYNFEHDVDSLFLSDTGICEGMQLSPWIARRYTETWASSPHPDSTSAVAATSSLSCGTTFEFSMSGGGVVEVNVYMESNYMYDQLSVLVMQVLYAGNPVVVGTAFISATDSDFVNGWRLVRVPLIGTGTYQGYISLMGMASAKSLVLVDSFRYIPSSLDEDSCVIYEDLSGSTEETITETTTETVIESSTTTLYTEESSITPIHTSTLQPDVIEECVTYNFEHDVDSLFLSDTGICEGMQLSPWIARRYTETWASSPHPDSTSAVAATSSLSCGTTFEFSMSGGGVVEVNVYMESNYMYDQLSVLVMQVLSAGNPVVVGTAFISATDSDFVNGWRLVRVALIGTGTYQGYISLMGTASAKSLVLVDSFRYIPPSLDEDSCVIYEVDLSESTTETAIESSSTTMKITATDTVTQKAPIESTTDNYRDTFPTSTTDSIAITPTTEIPTPITTPSIETTTDIDYDTDTTIPPTLYTEESSITPIHTSTLQPDVVEECVTYNFESDFDIRFSPDNYLCKGLLSWQLENYTSIDIGSPNPESTLFMAPHEEASCISSAVFKMEPYGTVEANVFMEPVQALDHIIIIAQRVTDKEYDTVAGFIKYHPGNEVFVPGWNVIRFSLLDLTSFDGYLIFIGSADRRSTVLVDSVRYIPPLTPPEDASCDVY